MDTNHQSILTDLHSIGLRSFGARVGHQFYSVRNFLLESTSIYIACFPMEIEEQTKDSRQTQSQMDSNGHRRATGAEKKNRERERERV